MENFVESANSTPVLIWISEIQIHITDLHTYTHKFKSKFQNFKNIDIHIDDDMIDRFFTLTDKRIDTTLDTNR